MPKAGVGIVQHVIMGGKMDEQAYDQDRTETLSCFQEFVRHFFLKILTVRETADYIRR